MITTAAIPPGGEGEIKVTLDTRGKKGALNKSIKVTSDDPQNPTSTIRVTAYVELDFEFESSSLYMGMVPKGKSSTKRAFIRVRDFEKVKVVGITTSSPFITARHVDRPKQDDDDGRIQIEVTVAPGLPVGRIKETVTVRSNLDRKPEALLRISGRVPDDVEIIPRSLDFSISRSQSTANGRTMKCIITNYRDDKPLEIIQVRDLDGHLSLQVKTQENGRKFELNATLKSEKAPEGGSLSGSIIITTNNPDHEEIRVIYTAVWKN